jgi:glycerophosphoryl diester phosphodiesterase
VLLFGAIHSENKSPQAAPDVIDTEKANNYRRWWNNPWRVVEPSGQAHAGEWTAEKEKRLRALVDRAHSNGLWIRFYTLDGATREELSCHGWFRGYNFGSIDAARVRWRAAIAAHVDYLASDQYELLGAEVRHSTAPSNAQTR